MAYTFRGDLSKSWALVYIGHRSVFLGFFVSWFVSRS